MSMVEVVLEQIERPSWFDEFAVWRMDVALGGEDPFGAGREERW